MSLNYEIIDLEINKEEITKREPTIIIFDINTLVKNKVFYYFYIITKLCKEHKDIIYKIYVAIISNKLSSTKYLYNINKYNPFTSLKNIKLNGNKKDLPKYHNMNDIINKLRVTEEILILTNDNINVIKSILPKDKHKIKYLDLNTISLYTNIIKKLFFNIKEYKLIGVKNINFVGMDTNEIYIDETNRYILTSISDNNYELALSIKEEIDDNIVYKLEKIYIHDKIKYKLEMDKFLSIIDPIVSYLYEMIIHNNYISINEKISNELNIIRNILNRYDGDILENVLFLKKIITNLINYIELNRIKKQFNIDIKYVNKNKINGYELDLINKNNNYINQILSLIEIKKMDNSIVEFNKNNINRIIDNNIKGILIQVKFTSNKLEDWDILKDKIITTTKIEYISNYLYNVEQYKKKNPNKLNNDTLYTDIIANSIIPIYINKEHWKLANKFICPILGLTFANNIYCFNDKYYQYMYIYLIYIIKETIEDPTVGIDILLNMIKTTYEISKDLKYIYGFSEYYKNINNITNFSKYLKVLGQIISIRFFNINFNQLIFNTINVLIKPYNIVVHDKIDIISLKKIDSLITSIDFIPKLQLILPTLIMFKILCKSLYLNLNNEINNGFINDDIKNNLINDINNFNYKSHKDLDYYINFFLKLYID